MLSGLYSAASSLQAVAENQEVIAHNLAHVDVPGFRRRVVTFETFQNAFADLQQRAELSDSVGTHVNQIATDFSEGIVQQTGRPLDVALHGKGFFVLEGPDGPLYTRSGVFHLNSDGELVNHDGLRVNGTGGPIITPPNTVPSQIAVADDGTLRVRPSLRLGQLEIVQFDNEAGLVSAGTTLYAAPDGVAVIDAEDVVVKQGARELSNVSPVDELVQMIAGMRLYEMSQRALQSISSAVEQHTTDQSQ